METLRPDSGFKTPGYERFWVRERFARKYVTPHFYGGDDASDFTANGGQTVLRSQQGRGPIGPTVGGRQVCQCAPRGRCLMGAIS